ncbi:MAG: ribosome-associated translation inhibitor RaiA, partial [Chloroflexota bacterium]|nr:ribosome-associated translation inhibitor RaiA [Chloroflexota bacterium]
SEAVEKYARKRVGKLDRYLPSISEGKLEITQEDTRLPEQRFGAQLTLNSNGVLIRAQAKASDIRVAIDEVMDAITNRIERYKGKLYDKGRGISLTRQGATETTEDEGPRVVKNKHFPVKPMSQDEAISQMELLGHDFFLFINAENGTPNLLYRRKDGNYGLIESVIE